jgi:hypothetical protein
MRIKLSTTKLSFSILLCVCFVLPTITNASETQGTINSGSKNAWSDNIGWINFAPTKGGIQITDTAITGSAWSNNNGWINFNPAKGGVLNDGQGHLSGSAWGEQTGWIDFRGVSINSSGKFTGAATGVVVGTLIFDCSKCDVETDWRPQGARVQPSSASRSGSFAYSNAVVSNPQTTADPAIAQPTVTESNPPQKSGIFTWLFKSSKKDNISNNPAVDKGSKSLSSNLPGTSTAVISPTTKDISRIYQTPVRIIQNIGLVIKDIFTQMVSFAYSIFYWIIT